MKKKLTKDIKILLVIGLGLLVLLNHLVSMGVINLERRSSGPLDRTLCPDGKVIFLLIDGLSYRYSNGTEYIKDDNSIFNKFNIFAKTKKEYPSRTIHRPSIVESPALTINSVKSFSTGSIPSTSITEMIQQDFKRYETVFDHLTESSKRAFYIGDIIWYTVLEPIKDQFVQIDYINYYDHSKFKDEETVSKIVERMKDKESWDVIVSHIADLDSQCHKSYLGSPGTLKALKKQNELVGKLIEEVDDNTTLIITSDHGLMREGCHYGNRTNETLSFLFAYRKNGFLGNHKEEFGVKGNLSLVDISRMFGFYSCSEAPFNNLGSMRPGLMDYEGERGELDRVVDVKFLDFLQKVELIKAKKFSLEGLNIKKISSDYAEFKSNDHQESKNTAGMELLEELVSFEKQVLELFRSKHNRYNHTLVLIFFTGVILFAASTTLHTLVSVSLPFSLKKNTNHFLSKIQSEKSAAVTAIVYFLLYLANQDTTIVLAFSLIAIMLFIAKAVDVYGKYQSTLLYYHGRVNLVYLVSRKSGSFWCFGLLMIILSIQQNSRYTMQELAVQNLILFYLLIEHCILPLAKYLVFKVSPGDVKERLRSFLEDVILMFVWSLMDKASLQRNRDKISGTYLEIIYQNHAKLLHLIFLSTLLTFLWMKILGNTKKRGMILRLNFYNSASVTILIPLVRLIGLEIDSFALTFNYCLQFLALMDLRKKREAYTEHKLNWLSLLLYAILPLLITYGGDTSPGVLLILGFLLDKKIREEGLTSSERYVVCLFLTYIGGRISGNLFNNADCRKCIEGVYEEQLSQSYLETFMSKNYTFTFSLLFSSFLILDKIQTQLSPYKNQERLQRVAKSKLDDFYSIFVSCLPWGIVAAMTSFEDKKQFLHAARLASLLINWIGCYTVVLATRTIMYFSDF